MLLLGSVGFHETVSDTFISVVGLHLFWGSERPSKLKCVNEVCLTELKISLLFKVIYLH